MRNKFLPIIGLILSFSTFAQQKPLEFDLGWRGGNLNPVKVKYVRDSVKQQTCVLAQNNSTLKGFLFDSEMRTTNSFSTGVLEKNMVGGFIKGKEIHVFVEEPYFISMDRVIFNIENGSTRNMSVPFNLKREKQLGKINADGAFLFITIDRKDPIINVYRFTEISEPEKISFDFRKSGSDKKLKDGKLWPALSTISGFSRSVDVALVDPDVECEAETADSPNKLYYSNGSLILLIDKDPSTLSIFELNLRSKQLSHKGIDRNYAPITSSTFLKPKYNSFLLQDRVYFVHTTSDTLSVSVYNLNNGAEIKTFKTAAKDSIIYKNTPIIQEGGGALYSMQTERELTKTRQIIRKMINGSAVITAAPNSENQHEVTIGAYKKVTQNSGGYTPMYGGATGRGMTGGFQMTVMPGFSSSWNKVTRFKVLFDPITAQTIKGPINPSAIERIQLYAEDFRIPKEGSCIFVANNYSQFAYFDKDEKKLIITKF